MGDVGRALPSYWLVQAGHIGIGGDGWSATGWAVMAAWTIGADRAGDAGLPARHREAVAPSATISVCDGSAKSRWRGARRSRSCASARASRSACSSSPGRSRTSATSRSSRACRSRSASASRSSSPSTCRSCRRPAGSPAAASPPSSARSRCCPSIAIVLLAAGAPASFSALFVYVAAATGMLLPPRIAAALILATGARRRDPGRGARGRRRRDRRDRADRGRDRRDDGRVRPRRRASTASCARPARSWRRSPSPRSGCGSRATCTTCSATACP